MTRMLLASILLGQVALAGTGHTPAKASVFRAEQIRTVYFSARDANGAVVTDLTAGDLVVKEGGKDREITSAKPATEPMQIAVLVDDSGTGAFQSPVAQFLQATVGHAQFAISILNPQAQKIVNFTEDVDNLKAALGKLGHRGRLTVDGEQIIAAVSDSARELQRRQAARPAILVLSSSGETVSSDAANQTLDDLKKSGATLNVLFYTGISIGKVLSEGPARSGGIIQQFNSSSAVSSAVAKVADNLMHQYVLTYTLPDGVRPNERLALTTTRKGVTLIAPTRISDK